MYSPEYCAQLVMNYRGFDYVAVVSNNNNIISPVAIYFSVVMR